MFGPSTDFDVQILESGSGYTRLSCNFVAVAIMIDQDSHIKPACSDWSIIKEHAAAFLFIRKTTESHFRSEKAPIHFWSRWYLWWLVLQRCFGARNRGQFVFERELHSNVPNIDDQGDILYNYQFHDILSQCFAKSSHGGLEPWESSILQLKKRATRN